MSKQLFNPQELDCWICPTQSSIPDDSPQPEKKRRKYGRQVEQVDKDGNVVKAWEHALAISQELGFAPSTLRRAIYGLREELGGYKWRYAGGEQNVKNYLHCTLEQWSLDGALVATYTNIMEAAKVVELEVDNIRRCVRGDRKTAGGFVWTYKPAA